MQYQVSKNKKSLFFLFLILPFLFLGAFKMYFRNAQNDLISTFSYPNKKFPIGLDTTDYSGNLIVDTAYHKIPNFAFKNQFGQTITNQAYKNKIYIADFFFTSCGYQCPKMTEQMKRLQEEFIHDDRIMFASFSIDPKRDSVQKLKEYADNYGVIPGKWNLLTGDKEEIYTLAKEGFFISAVDYNKDSITDDILHSDRFVIVDPEGIIRGFHIGTDENAVNHLKGDIALLLFEYKKK